MKSFELIDYLQHDAYSYPLTMLTYCEEGTCPVIGKDVLTMDGTPVPYETVPTGKNTYNLKLIADLPTNARHNFRWQKGNQHIKTTLSNKDGADNGTLSCTSLCGGLFFISYLSKLKINFSLQTDLTLCKEEERVEGGDIERIFRKALHYTDGSIYRICVKIKPFPDYLEIYEDMTEFKGEGKLVCAFDGFAPTYRYTLDRKKEKVGAYLKEDGSFPFYINPLTARVSPWDQRYVSYVEGDFALGLLLHDLKHFDDGEYAIWGSKNTLAFRLFKNRVEAPVVKGKRAFMLTFMENKPLDYIEKHYLRYFSMVSLNDVKDWVLAWEDDKTEYPKYYRTTENTRWGDWWFKEMQGTPTAQDFMELLDERSTTFRQAEKIAPVSSRAFADTWAPLFDVTASQMTDEQFARARAALAFICYLFSSENYYPTENMLAGHPNFLTDIAAPVGIFAALLGKNHPHFERFMDYYQKAILRNFKYHTRPDVPAYESKGGRWTENVGCYMMGMLRCIITVCNVIYRVHGKMVLASEEVHKVLQFLVAIQTPENESGRRVYPPQGAHAATGEFGKLGHGFYLPMLQLALMCKEIYPKEANAFLYNYRNKADLEFLLSDEEVEGASFRRFVKEIEGTPPVLRSEKFTGYGYVLRSHSNTTNEMQVILQQIDEGPNYRWGRAAQGGCGELYYYANRKAYTGHAPEDVGDENRGDVQACTNFGVLVDHEYKSVGRNELTEPLVDFGFVQYARVNASEYSQPYYRYRSVLMVENQYIAVYDAVADMAQHGRFVWANKQNGEMPFIHNIRPGVSGVAANSGASLDSIDGNARTKDLTKTLVYQGRGDFLTVVTHLRNCGDEHLVRKIQVKEYGCEILFPAYADYVFDEQTYASYEESNRAFCGRVGYIREKYKKNYLAILDGEYIRSGDTAISMPYDKDIRRAVGCVVTHSMVDGKCYLQAETEISVTTPIQGKVWVDGKSVAFTNEEGRYAFTLPKGRHIWNIGDAPAPVKVESAEEKRIDDRAWDNHPEKGFVRDTRSHEHGYAGFRYIENFEKPILRYPTEEK